MDASVIGSPPISVIVLAGKQAVTRASLFFFPYWTLSLISLTLSTLPTSPSLPPGLRRRGYTAGILNAFCKDIGVTRNENIIQARLCLSFAPLVLS